MAIYLRIIVAVRRLLFENLYENSALAPRFGNITSGSAAVLSLLSIAPRVSDPISIPQPLVCMTVEGLLLPLGLVDSRIFKAGETSLVKKTTPKPNTDSPRSIVLLLPFLTTKCVGIRVWRIAFFLHIFNFSIIS